MARALTDYSALTFDCYGTLIDWESGIWDALQPLLHRNGCTEITREAGLLAFAETESAQQAETPDMVYNQLLTRVHASLAKRFDLKTDDGLDRAFGASLPHWPAFPDTADALRVLKNHFKLVILSNVSREGFAASNRKLGVTFAVAAGKYCLKVISFMAGSQAQAKGVRAGWRVTQVRARARSSICRAPFL